MLSWYAIYVRSQTDALVRDRLLAGNVEAFFPSYHVLSHDRKRRVEKNLFPSYVFERVNFEDHERHAIPLPEVVRIVGQGRVPLAIADAEIDSLKLIMSQPGVAPHECLANERDRIRVLRGTLAGAEGQVVRLKNSRNRVLLVISLSQVQLACSVEVDAADVELVERAEV